MSDVLNDLPFTPLTREAWRALLDKELKGSSYDEFLHWKSTEGFEIESYQDTLPSPMPVLLPLKRAWMAVEYVPETDAAAANKHALRALMTGAEAIWFSYPFAEQSAKIAAAQVETNIAPVFMEGQTFRDVFEPLLREGGSVDVQPGGSMILMDGARLRERGATVVEECALLLAQGIEMLDAGVAPQSMMFKSGFANLYLSEIAKLRALRWLWAAVLAAREEEPANPEVLAVNLDHLYTQNDEYSNILRATSSAMAAIIGGASYVMIRPWDLNWRETNDFSGRISRNIQNLLRDEARLDKNLNPADGAYFIEHLTVKIAERAWKLVQHIESAGGFSEFTRSGMLKSLLSASGKRTLAAYKGNDKILLGVNKYQPADKQDEQYLGALHYDLLPEYVHLPFAIQKPDA